MTSPTPPEGKEQTKARRDVKRQVQLVAHKRLCAGDFKFNGKVISGIGRYKPVTALLNP